MCVYCFHLCFLCDTARSLVSSPLPPLYRTSHTRPWFLLWCWVAFAALIRCYRCCLFVCLCVCAKSVYFAVAADPQNPHGLYCLRIVDQTGQHLCLRLPPPIAFLVLLSCKHLSQYHHAHAVQSFCSCCECRCECVFQSPLRSHHKRRRCAARAEAASTKAHWRRKQRWIGACRQNTGRRRRVCAVRIICDCSASHCAAVDALAVSAVQAAALHACVGVVCSRAAQGAHVARPLGSCPEAE